MILISLQAYFIRCFQNDLIFNKNMSSISSEYIEASNKGVGIFVMKTHRIQLHNEHFHMPVAHPWICFSPRNQKWIRMHSLLYKHIDNIYIRILYTKCKESGNIQDLNQKAMARLCTRRASLWFYADIGSLPHKWLILFVLNFRKFDCCGFRCANCCCENY